MTTPDNLIPRLAASNPVAHLGPCGPEEAAEAKRVLQRVLASPQHRVVPSSSARASAVAAALTAVAITVAVGALVLLGHHRRAAGPRIGDSSSQQLVRTFSVLRTPPTETDRRLSKCLEQVAPSLAKARAPLSLANSRTFLRCGGGLSGGLLIAPGRQPGESAQYLEPSLARGWQPQLLRVVTLRRWGYEVMLMPLTFELSASHRRTEGLVASVRRRQSPIGFGGSGPTSLTWLQAHGVAISLYLGSTNRAVNRDIVIVPDGVARVTLGSFTTATPSFSRRLHGIATVSARVHNNVAALQLKTPIVKSTGPTGLVATEGSANAIWYDTSGNVIARTTTPLMLYVNGAR